MRQKKRKKAKERKRKWVHNMVDWEAIWEIMFIFGWELAGKLSSVTQWKILSWKCKSHECPHERTVQMKEKYWAPLFFSFTRLDFDDNANGRLEKLFFFFPFLSFIFFLSAALWAGIFPFFRSLPACSMWAASSFNRWMN